MNPKLQFAAGWSTSGSTAHVCESMRIGAKKPKRPKKPKQKFASDEVRDMASRAFENGSYGAFSLLVQSYPKVWDNPDAIPVPYPHEKALPKRKVERAEPTKAELDLAQRQRKWQIICDRRYEVRKQAKDLLKRKKFAEFSQLVNDNPKSWDEMPPRPES